MAELASAGVEIGKCICGPLSRSYSNISNYKTNLCTLGTKAQTLECRRADVELSVESANSSGQVIKSEVIDWIGRVRKISEAVEALNTAAGLNRRCVCGLFPDYRRRSRLSGEAMRLCAEIEAALNEPRFESVSLRRAVPEFKISPAEISTTFSSTQSALKKVREALKSSGVGMVGVHGTGGIGKTTVAKEAAVRALAEGLFDSVAFVTVSKSPNVARLQKSIAEALGLILGTNESCERRASLIKDRIANQKRVLVVLDDLWQALEPEIIGVPLGRELGNSKILVTTRLENVCHRMGCQEKVSLDLWSELESWEFFKNTAGANFESSRRFEGIAKSVAKECGGLPLALVAVAKALGDKDVKEWEKALNRLKNSMPPNSDDDSLVFNSLMLSFDFLDAVEKACFLICCLFPEDHNICHEELARYLFGLGIFPQANTFDEARADTGTISKKLISSGMLLLGDKSEHVKMHDVIRDFAIQLTSLSLPSVNKKKKNKSNNNGDSNGWAEKQVFMVQTGNHALREWPLRESYKNYTAISFVSNEIRRLPDSPDCAKLQTLLLQDNNSLEEIPSQFFENFESLRVLDAAGAEAPSLPLSFKSLKKTMRTLHLDRCKVADISVLGELEKLAILSLKHSVISELPEEIGKLRNLRLLDLTLSFRIKRIQPGILPGLQCLEELYLKGSFSQWHNGIDPETSRNACFSEIVSLPRLIVLSVDIDCAKCLPLDVTQVPRWQRLNVSLCRATKGRLFGVHSKQGGECSTTMLLDASMQSLPEWFNLAASSNTEKLTYLGCEALNLIDEHESGRLSGLKSLIVDDCEVIKYLIRPPVQDGRPVFEALRELKLHEMSSMEGICSGDLPKGSLERLKFIEVQQCGGLVNSLLTPNLIKHASNLERLRANGDHVSEVFEFEGLEEGLYLGSLREMRLENLYGLKTILKGPARFADFTKLRLVSVIKCKKLKILFSVSISEGLSELEDLWVEECLLIEEVIRIEVGAKLGRLKLPKLKTLCLVNLPRLSSFHAGDAHLECPSLEHVHVRGCPNFQTSISEFNSSNSVHENDEQHLKNLSKRMTKPEY